jgi:elongator complex protein 1
LQEESVGTIENGISAMAWSPDYEIVVFATRANTLLMMTQDWDPIAEQPILPNNPELFEKTKFDSLAPRISWRGDGQFFAVSSVENGVTVFRTYERSGKLHSRSEDISKSGVQQSNLLSWKPSGELIASSGRHPGSGKHEIIFFERNGLRHGEFALRDPEATVLDIQWNAASELISLLLELAPGKRVIQVWYTKNYHWYLKQEFNFAGKEATCMRWDEERANLLSVACASGEVSLLEFALFVDISQGNYEKNESVVAMIDGSKIQFTPTRRVVPPPPFASAEVSIAPERVSYVDFAPHTGAIAVKHIGAKISVFEPYTAKFEAGKPPVYNIAPKLRGTFTLDAEFAELRSVQFLDEQHIIGVISTSDQDDIVIFALSGSEAKLTCRSKAAKHPARVLALVQNKDSASVYAEFDNGHVSQVFIPSDWSSIRLAAAGQLPAPCPWIASAAFGDSSHPANDIMDSDEHIIALSERNKLYVQRAGSPESNPTVVSQECNSFAVQSGAFLLFTTVSHTLRFMSLQRTVEENMEILASASTNKNAPKSTSKGGGTSTSGGNWNDSIREVEQGSILISVVANLGTRVVLQMPRGNLETIEPRALVVSQVRRAIDKIDYQSAFVAARKHRLDLNLLYDHNPELFMSNLDSFVKQLADVDYLNLFISALTKEDVTRTIFVDLWRDPKGKEPQEQIIKRKLRALKLGKAPPITDNKVSHVCDALRAVFQRLDSNKYLLSILTTYVLRDPPQTEEALKLIQRLRQHEQSQGLMSQETTAGNTADKALKYLIFLVDVNTLYNISLGMYDLDLVLAVAQKSQKDPREYLPFLADLQKQEKFVQRFKIDLHLKRYEKALESISRAEPQELHFKEKLIPLVEERKLFPKAIEIYYNNSNKLFVPVFFLLFLVVVVIFSLQSAPSFSCWAKPLFLHSKVWPIHLLLSNCGT